MGNILRVHTEAVREGGIVWSGLCSMCFAEAFESGPTKGKRA